MDKNKIQHHAENILSNLEELKLFIAKTESETFKLLKNFDDPEALGSVLSHITAESLFKKAQDVRYWAIRLDLLLDLAEEDSVTLIAEPDDSVKHDTMPCSTWCSFCKDCPNGCDHCK